MNHMLAALLNLLLQTNARSAPPPLPYYTHHVTCWCEKCDGQDQAGHWTAARELSAYRKQGVASSRFFSVSPGEQITVLNGVVIVDRADLIRVLKPMTALDVPGEFEPGDAIWRVQIVASIFFGLPPCRGKQLRIESSGQDTACQRESPSKCRLGSFDLC